MVCFALLNFAKDLRLKFEPEERCRVVLLSGLQRSQDKLNRFEAPRVETWAAMHCV